MAAIRLRYFEHNSSSDTETSSNLKGQRIKEYLMYYTLTFYFPRLSEKNCEETQTL